ncbi:porin [Acidovorax sp. JHL-9]|uniref:porin n=1 Tax=Acidovorax sp. JHL-9 TaxID=1276756 RepID=UPI00138B1226|nr:porin [Acidovorax sp. JHL-9]
MRIQTTLRVSAAIAALAVAPAWAQVTLSGFVDLNLESIKTGGDRTTRVSSAGLNTSRLQFRADEDLGGGLRARAVHEMTFAADTGAQGNPRETYVQLASPSWGDVSLGRLNLSSYWMYGYADPSFSADYSMLSNVMVFYAPWRESNAIAYNSPRVGGFQFKGTVTAGKEDSTRNGRVTSFGVDYRDGPLYVGLASDRKYQVNIRKAGQMESSTDNYLSAVYRLGAHDLTAVVHNYSGYYAYPPYVDFHAKGNSVALGARINLSDANRIHVTVVRRNDKKNDALADATGLLVGYMHNMSKRTTLYANYGMVHHKQKTSVRYPISWSAASPLSAENPRGVQFGIRHAF